MSKKLISVALTVVSGTALAWGVACSNSSSGSNDAGSSSSSGGSSSGTTSSGSSSGTTSSGSSSGTTSSSGSGSSSGAGDAGDGGSSGGACTLTPTSPLIDDQSAPMGTQIALAATFTPAACGHIGTWFDYPSGSGTITPAQGMFAFSPSPAALPADAGPAVVSDAGDAGGPQAACVSGITGSTQYNTSGIGLNFATVPGSDGGGADAGMQSLIVQLPDKQETPGFGCDNTVKDHECGGATKAITIGPGWQPEHLAFSTFSINPNYGDLNETAIDPSTLTQFQ